MKSIVVGDGTLGVVLRKALEADGLSLRHPEGVLGDRLEPALANASLVINAAGPRLRPGLAGGDYLREHVGIATTIARSLPAGAHLVHIGSASVYGSRRGPIGADTSEDPGSFPSPMHAWAKLSGELAARAICRERGVRVTVLRPPVVYGPGIESGLDSMMTLAERRGVVINLEPASLPQQLVHIDLFVRAVRAVIASHREWSRPIPIADPFVITNGEITDALRRQARRPIKVSVPLDLMRNVLEHWPGWPERDGPLRLVALGVVGVGITFDMTETFASLGIDASEFTRERMMTPYLERT